MKARHHFFAPGTVIHCRPASIWRKPVVWLAVGVFVLIFVGAALTS